MALDSSAIFMKAVEGSIIVIEWDIFNVDVGKYGAETGILVNSGYLFW